MLKDFFYAMHRSMFRNNVREFLRQMDLSWKSYWDIPEPARAHFVLTLLWAESIPPSGILTEIFKKEKKQGPVSSIIRHETKWWMRPYPRLDKVIEVALGRLEHKRLLTLFHRYPTEILKLMPKKDLPLMVPEVHGEYLAGLLESRLNPPKKPTTVFLEP
jgi:hypothetical protein